MAAIIPRLDLFISLVGALASSCLALIFPPLIDLATDWDEEEDDGESMSSSTISKSRFWWCCKNFTICLFGVIGFVTGTYASMNDIIKYFIHPNA